ncbi:MAG TPA: hypothetical protein VFD41_07530 [Actinomycetales bacterium]|nr:hypothetical protein [Actinomycetales bacterium]
MTQDDDARPLAAADRLALIEEQHARVASALDVDERLLYSVWGLAWLIGFAGLYATAGSDPLIDLPHEGAVGALLALLVAAAVLTAVHIARATRGLRGVSSVTGAMYGWTWMLAFAALPVLIASAERLGVSDEALDMLWTTLPGLLVGVLYMVGGALWQDRFQFGLGVWILASTSLGSLAGLPGVYLVLSLAGGGGMLAAAAWFAVRRRRGAAR